MSRLLACLCLAILGLPGFAAEPTLADARQRWLRGNFEEARAAYRTLLAQEQFRAAAAVGLSRVDEAQGRYDDAVKVLADAVSAVPKDPDLLARQAELAYTLGRWDEAEKAAAAALAVNDDHLLARFVRAQVKRDRGDLDGAYAEFRWFVTTYNQRQFKAADDLLIIGRAGVEDARKNSLTNQLRTILTTVYADALAADKDLWLAELHAGLLLLEKYNRGEALSAFDKALAICPQSAEALVGKAQAAYQGFEMRDAEQFVEQALKINPKLPAALRLRADLHLFAGDLEAGKRDLEAARTVNPRDERTLGRLAACLLLLKQRPAVERLTADLAGFSKNPGLFHHELAERLEERRLYGQAEAHYRKALELRPDLPWPRNSLALLAMRLGKEGEAKKLLDDAFNADRFNIRIANSRKVLRHLEGYKDLKTEHFHLRFDPKTDEVLARYMAAYLEDYYRKLADLYGYKPEGPILIEVFNNHEMFSGRTVAVPDLHTIGACTGRVVAMVSPHGQGIRRKFNWGRVIRHELVHIFNLEQTGFQVPHWLTEGLAVGQEGFPRPPLWNRILAERVAAERLFNLDTITLGFIRPKSPLEWQLAYCQSNLYVEYMVKTHGPDSIKRMLQAYADGLDTGAALQAACQTDKAAFEAGYRKFLGEVVRGLPIRPVEVTQTLKQLEEAHEKNPDDLDTAAKLAEQYLRRRKTPDAERLVDEVLGKKKGHPQASVVKARLQMTAGDAAAARATLEAALEGEKADPRVLIALARLLFEAKEFDRAADLFEQGRKLEPGEPAWLEELAKVYRQTDNKPKLRSVLQELVPTDPDDLAGRKRVAELLLAEGQPAEAERFAREALEIDVTDGEVRALLVQALEAQGKAAAAEALKKLLGE